MKSDIKELNYAYLVCLREAASEDIREASVRFGVDQALLRQISSAPLLQLQELADPSFLVFKLRAPEAVRSHLNNRDGSLVRAVVSMVTEASE